MCSRRRRCSGSDELWFIYSRRLCLRPQFSVLATITNEVPPAVTATHSATNMATSMAAALAASLPAPQTAPTPAAPTYEAIPASMSKVIDIEAEIPLTNVQLDGLVGSSLPTKCPTGAAEAKNSDVAAGRDENRETQSRGAAVGCAGPPPRYRPRRDPRDIQLIPLATCG